MPRMKRWPAALLFAFAGCESSPSNPDPIVPSSATFTSAGIQAWRERKAETDAKPEGPKVTRPVVPGGSTAKVVELTVENGNREDMMRLVPFLVSPEEWQLLGVVRLGWTHRTWRFLHTGADLKEIGPLNFHPRGERRYDLKDLGRRATGTPGPDHEDSAERGRIGAVTTAEDP